MHESIPPTLVLDRLLEPVGRSLSRSAGRKLIRLRADEQTQLRVKELAEKCNEGNPLSRRA